MNPQNYNKLFSEEKFHNDFYSKDRGLLIFIEKVINNLGSSTYVLIQGELGVGKTLLSNIITEYPQTADAKSGGWPRRTLEVQGLRGKNKHSRSITGEWEKILKKLIPNGITYLEGTIIIENVDNFSLDQQEYLLDMLTSNNPYKGDVMMDWVISGKRVITTSRENSKALVLKGLFNEHLFKEIAADTIIPIPPIRERKDDISFLFQIYCEEKLNLKKKDIPSQTFEILRNHPFPGNVTELKALIERLVKMKETDFGPDTIKRYLEMQNFGFSKKRLDRGPESQKVSSGTPADKGGHAWSDINSIELIPGGDSIEKIKPPIVLIGFNNGRSKPVHLQKMPFTFLWFLIAQHLSMSEGKEYWIENLNKPSVCKIIDKIWKRVYHRTFTSEVKNQVDSHSEILDKPDQEILSEILNNPDIVNSIYLRGKGSWVIDPPNEKRKAHISKIIICFAEFLSDTSMLEDLFISGNKQIINGTEWLGLYKFDPTRVSHIKFILPEI